MLRYITLGSSRLMANLKKRYVRLEEVEDFTSFTKGDILDAIENKKIMFCASVDLQNMGAITTSLESPTVGAVFNYSGVIALNREDSRTMAITQHELEIKNAIVLDTSKVAYWRSVPDVFPDIRADAIAFESSPTQIPNHAFAAFVCVEKGFTGKQVRNNMLAMLSQIGTTTKHSNQPFNSLDGQDFNQYLVSSPITIMPTMLRIDLEQVNHYLGAGEDSKTKTRKSCVPVTDSSVLVNPLEQIVYRLLEDTPNVRADKLWNILRKDV